MRWLQGDRIIGITVAPRSALSGKPSWPQISGRWTPVRLQGATILQERDVRMLLLFILCD